MKSGSYLAVAALGVCAAGAAALCFWRRRKPVQAVQDAKTPENCFLSEWTSVLTSDARVFNGLYSGLQRAAGGTAKRLCRFLFCRAAAPLYFKNICSSFS